MTDIWVTADQHFGHANIIKSCGRPFAGVEEMEEVLVEAWNSCVKPMDTVYHLGDLVYGREARPVHEYLARLNGRISLVPGNHDRRPTLDAVARHPLHTVCPLIFDVRLEANPGLMIVLCHYGMRAWPGSHRGTVHLFAHSHGRLERYGRSMDIGVDTNPSYKPYNLEEIVERLRALQKRPAEVGETPI